jgi:hypothetical protein
VNLKTAYKVQSAHGSVAGTWTAAVNDAHVTAAHATTPAAGGGGPVTQAAESAGWAPNGLVSLDRLLRFW